MISGFEHLLGTIIEKSDFHWHFSILPEVRVAAPSVEGDLQERLIRPGNSLITHRTPASRPGDSLIRRRYGGGVGNRCRWAERFAMSEQRLQVGSKEDVHLYE